MNRLSEPSLFAEFLQDGLFSTNRISIFRNRQSLSNKSNENCFLPLSNSLI